MGVDQVILKPKKRAVFLDRDGVLNNAVIRDGKPYPPDGLAEISINTGVAIGLDRLHKKDFLLIVITNQPDVSRGRITKESVEEIHSFLQEMLPLDQIRVCYHDNNHRCECRKPKPGSLLQAADEYNINLSDSFMVGDRWSDVEAGRSAGCKTIFIDNGYDEQKPDDPDFYVGSFGEAVEIILGSCQHN